MLLGAMLKLKKLLLDLLVAIILNISIVGGGARGYAEGFNGC